MQKNTKPGLFDLSDPIVGHISKELIQKWLDSSQTDEDHARILAPYRRKGTIVCSDLSGLSKLTAERALIQVLKLVSESKEFIYSHGKEIGGEAIGIWIADNTLMFYKDEIPAQNVVHQMVLAQKSIDDLAVNVGIGIHYGTVYHIGGGLYGDDAEWIEEFTENSSRGLDILVSATVKEMLEAPFDAFETFLEMFSLQYKGLALEGTSSCDIVYPAPFDLEFQEQLQTWNPELEEFDLEGEYLPHETTIGLLSFYPADDLRLLDRFVQQVEISHHTKILSKRYGVELLKTNGSLAIFHSPDTKAIVSCSKELYQRFQSLGLLVSIGVSKGDVLIFDLGEERDIAGEPVNLASKMAEDSGYHGALLFDHTVADEARAQGITEPFSIIVSKMQLDGVRLGG